MEQCIVVFTDRRWSFKGRGLNPATWVLDRHRPQQHQQLVEGEESDLVHIAVVDPGEQELHMPVGGLPAHHKPYEINHLTVVQTAIAINVKALELFID